MRRGEERQRKTGQEGRGGEEEHQSYHQSKCVAALSLAAPQLLLLSPVHILLLLLVLPVVVESHTMLLPCNQHQHHRHNSTYNSSSSSSTHRHSLMMLKHLLLGRGLMSRSVRALLMMVVIAPLKKRALLGRTAPGWANTPSSALRSCCLFVWECELVCDYGGCLCEERWGQGCAETGTGGQKGLSELRGQLAEKGATQ